MVGKTQQLPQRGSALSISGPSPPTPVSEISLACRLDAERSASRYRGAWLSTHSKRQFAARRLCPSLEKSEAGNDMPALDAGHERLRRLHAPGQVGLREPGLTPPARQLRGQLSEIHIEL
jgi:hypothetical protein